MSNSYFCIFTVNLSRLLTPFLMLIFAAIRNKLKNEEEKSKITKERNKCCHLKLRMNIDNLDEIINKNLELKVNGLEEQLNATTLTQLGKLFNNFNSVFTLNYFF